MNEVSIIALLIIMLLITYFLVYRNFKVYNFRVRLLHEESNYLQEHLAEINLNNGIFRRFKALPSYDSMMFKFWIPFKKYTRDLSEFYK